MNTPIAPQAARWREHWARQQNGRLGRAHQASLAAWQRLDAEHERCLAVATAFRPDRDGERYASLRLKRDETVYWFVGGVRMVESAVAAGLRPPDHREYLRPAPAGPPAVAARAVDVGRLAVTSQRVIFLGRARREWAYAKLTGFAHTPAGQTLMLVSNRKKVSGVWPAPDAVADFRLRLALAMADAEGQRDGFVGALADRARQTRQAVPPAPALLTPAQAPASAWLTGGRLVAVLGAAALLFCGVIGTAMAGNDPTPGAQPAPAGTAATPSPTAAVRPDPVRSPSPSPTPTAAAAATPTAEPVARDATRPQARAVGDCAAYVDSDGWCVDGIGDYDCEGGSGNGPNYAPSDVELANPAVDPFGLDRDGDGVGCQSPAAPAPPPPPPNPGTDPRFGTCGEAIENGYGPYRRGQDPEYDWYRDADSDGVVCE